MQGVAAVRRRGTRPACTRRTTRRIAPCSWSAWTRRAASRGRGCDAGQGTRLLHRLRPRRADLEQPGLPEPRRAAASSGRSTTRGARSWQQLEMPGVTYVDGFNVPNYENRPDPRRSSSCRSPPDEAQKFMQTPAEFERRAVRQRARHHQADHVHVRRARPALGRRGDGLSERSAQRQARRRSHQDPRGHQRRRPRRQVHGLRRAPQPADEPRRSPTAASSSRRRRTSCS